MSPSPAAGWTSRSVAGPACLGGRCSADYGRSGGLKIVPSFVLVDPRLSVSCGVISQGYCIAFSQTKELGE